MSCSGTEARRPRSTSGEPALAAGVIDAVAPHKALAARISQIDVSDVRDAVVLLDDDSAFLHLGTEKFVERLKVYLEIAPALRERVAEMDYVDLRFGSRVYVRGAGGKRRSSLAWRRARHCAVASSRRDADRFCSEGDAVARKERYLVGLDVGTSKVTAIVGETTEDGGLDIIGIGLADSRGIRRGVVVNLEAAVEAIKKAIEEAELTAGVDIDSVHLALSGAHVKAFNSRGVVAVAGKNREITREDVRRAIDAAKAVALPNGREILHVLPQDFVVDEQDGIGAPVGMTGARLEVNVHIVTGSQSSTQNIVAAVNRAGVAVLETVLEQLAASEGVLTHGREGTRCRARRYRRRHDGFRDLRARQSVAHRGGRDWRRSLHQRHRGRAADADSGCGKDQAPLRLRAVGDGRRGRDDGGGERWRTASRG